MGICRCRTPQLHSVLNATSLSTTPSPPPEIFFSLLVGCVSARVSLLGTPRLRREKRKRNDSVCLAFLRLLRGFASSSQARWRCLRLPIFPSPSYRCPLSGPCSPILDKSCKHRVSSLHLSRSLLVLRSKPPAVLLGHSELLISFPCLKAVVGLKARLRVRSRDVWNEHR